MKKARLLVTSLLPGETHKQLEGDFELTLNTKARSLTREELLSLAKGKDAIISVLVNSIDEEFFKTCPSVKVVANVAVGYDNIDIDAAKARDLIVANTPGVLTETTADLAFALILSGARRLCEAERYLRQGNWKEFALDLLLGQDVHHKTLGIIGLGRIGQAVARRAKGFSMKILYSQPRRVSAEMEAELSCQYSTFEDLLGRSDFVSLHCPLNENTHHLIGSAELEQMKSSSMIINTARGAIIDEKALAAALLKKTIKAAALDVFEHEPQINSTLLNLENAVLLPHIGSASIETRTKMGQMAVDAVLSSFHGRQPENLVNPESWPGFLKKLEAAGALIS